MSDVIKQGGNPLEAMGDIIKSASIRAQDEPEMTLEDNEKIEITNQAVQQE